MTPLPSRKLPAIDPIQHCNVCPPRPQLAPLDMLLHPGFGDACVLRDDEIASTVDENATVAQAEGIAVLDPDHDWRIEIHGPFYSAVYQRQGEGEWVLVGRGEGFA